MATGHAPYSGVVIQEGAPFPPYELADQDGNPHSSTDRRGSSLYFFYPKDDTSGCTAEACNFRDHQAEFAAAGLGVSVFGVSPDPVKSHKKFAEKYQLNFPLLADTERTLIEPLGLWVEKTLYGRKYMGVDRTTVLVDADGNIEKVWRKVKPENHAVEVLEFLKAT